MENDNTPMRQNGDENRPASVWTPEDASRFLSSAIQEAQRPLTDALKQRSVSPGIFALVIALLVACAAVCGWVLIDRLEKSEQAAASARLDRDVAIDKRHEALAKHEAVSARLSSTQEQADRTKRELEVENDRLRTEAAGYKSSDEELKRLRVDLNRYRRQTELLRTQISGLEMEKQALARQLHAVKLLADPDDEGNLQIAANSAEEQNFDDLLNTPPPTPDGPTLTAPPPSLPPEPETSQPGLPDPPAVEAMSAPIPESTALDGVSPEEAAEPALDQAVAAEAPPPSVQPDEAVTPGMSDDIAPAGPVEGEAENL